VYFVVESSCINVVLVVILTNGRVFIDP